MDEAVLREKGLEPMNRRLASAENFRLLIGRRATLAPCANGVVHCVVFALTTAKWINCTRKTLSVFTAPRP
jgi:hypothetical protein